MSSVKPPGQTLVKLVASLQRLLPDRTLNINDLKSPSKEFVIDWYVTFLGLLGMGKNLARELSNVQSDNAHYAVYGDMVALTKLSFTLKFVVSKILFDEITPFGLMDLLRPTPGRTMAFFTGITNFLFYAANLHSNVENVLEELDVKKEHYQAFLQKREDLLSLLNDKASARAEIHDLELEITKLESKYQDVARDVRLLEKETVEKENVLKELEMKHEQVTACLSKEEKELQSAEAQIILSPETVMLQKSQLQQKLKDVEEKITCSQNMLTTKRETVKKLENIQEDLDQKRSSVEKIVAEWKSINVSKERIAELRKIRSKLEEQVSEENSERQKLHVKEVHLQESLSGLKLRLETKRQDSETRKAALKKEYKDLSKQKAGELQHAREEEKRLSDSISRAVKINTVMNKAYEDQYARLLAKERQLGEEVARELEEATTRLIERKGGG